MRRASRWLLIVALVGVGGAVLYYSPRIHRLSSIGAGYVAKQMCSCVFVDGRTFESCRPDMPPDMASVRAEVLHGDKGIRAWVPLVVERTARYAPRFGCTLY